MVFFVFQKGREVWTRFSLSLLKVRLSSSSQFWKIIILEFISEIYQLMQDINNIHDSTGNTLRVVIVSVESLLIVSNS